MRAKLFVPSGAPLQWSSGERFLPLQPNPLKTWSSDRVLPWPMSGLTRANFDALDFLAGVSAAAVAAAPMARDAVRANAAAAMTASRAAKARPGLVRPRLPAILVLRL